MCNIKKEDRIGTKVMAEEFFAFLNGEEMADHEVITEESPESPSLDGSEDIQFMTDAHPSSEPGFVTPENCISPPPIPDVRTLRRSNMVSTPDPLLVSTADEPQHSQVPSLFGNLLQHTSNGIFSHTGTAASFVSSNTTNSSPIMATGIRSIPVHVSDRDNPQVNYFNCESFRFRPPISAFGNRASNSPTPYALRAQAFQERFHTQDVYRFSVPRLLPSFGQSWRPTSSLRSASKLIDNSSHAASSTAMESTSISTSEAPSIRRAESAFMDTRDSTPALTSTESDLMKPITCSAQHLNLKNLSTSNAMVGTSHTSQANAFVNGVLSQSLATANQRNQGTSNDATQKRNQAAQPTTLDGIFGNYRNNTQTPFWNDTDDVRFLGPIMHPQIIWQQSNSTTKDAAQLNLRNTINDLLTEKSQLTNELRDVKKALSEAEATVKTLNADINGMYNMKNRLQDKTHKYKQKLEKAQVLQDLLFKVTLDCRKLQAENQCLKLTNDRLAKDIDFLFEFFSKRVRKSTTSDVINEQDQKGEAGADDDSKEDQDDDENEDDDDDNDEDDDDNDEEMDHHDNEDDDNDDDEDFGGGSSNSEYRNRDHGPFFLPHDSNTSPPNDTQNSFSYDRITDNQALKMNLQSSKHVNLFTVADRQLFLCVRDKPGVISEETDVSRKPTCSFLEQSKIKRKMNDEKFQIGDSLFKKAKICNLAQPLLRKPTFKAKIPQLRLLSCKQCPKPKHMQRQSKATNL